jgi:diguanylate cyclase (GGDEF)-like protein
VLAAAAMGFVILSIATFTKHNQEYLLAAFTAEEASRQIARLDALTGLSNRTELTRQLEHSCRTLPPESDPRRGVFAVLYLDLDAFKSVNDNHGHAAGDELLRQVANCLRETASSAEIIARIGGDEFVIVLRDADALAARAVADEIIGAISRPRTLSSGVTVQVGCSVGVCVAPDQARDPELLMARADSALYRSKSLGKGQSGLWRTLA